MQVLQRWFYSIAIVLASAVCLAQSTQYMQSVSIENDNDFSGFDLIDIDSNQLFVLAEHWHNIRTVPKATMKLLKYLHQYANVRILAIEQGASAAHMINSYLNSGDTIVLRQIARNTLFWGKEHWEFFEELKAFNENLPLEEQVFVQSIDIEYKMASAIFVINELIGDKSIPMALEGTVGVFKSIFEDTRAHRESFQGLSVMHYYDRDAVENLVLLTIDQLERKSELYTEFFQEDFIQFATLILELDDGLTFDYTNPNNKYKFRDNLIHQKFYSLVEEFPNAGVLCVIGMRHATKNSSIYKLDNEKDSPLYEKVCKIKISALQNKVIVSSDLKRLNYNYPKQLKVNPATLIKHTDDDAALKSSKDFDYTLFINSSGELTPFEKVFKREYGD